MIQYSLVILVFYLCDNHKYNLCYLGCNIKSEINIDSKDFISTLQLVFLKVVLLSSVFAFTGYNENVKYSFLESVKTELLYSSEISPDFVTIDLNKRCQTSYFKSKYVLNQDNHLWLSQNTGRLSNIRYKSIRRKILSFDIDQIKLPIKSISTIPEDKYFSFSQA